MNGKQKGVFMIEPLNVTREDFPKSEKRSEGMKILEQKYDNYEIRYHRDVVYIERPEAKLTLQLMLTQPDNPFILYVTGSAFHWQDIPPTIPKIALIANKGFNVASVQYRGSDAAQFPAQMLDVKAAVRFIKLNAEKYGYNADKIFLMGDSSGGHTVLMAGLTAGIAEFEEEIYSEVSSDVSAVIDLYGPTDISKMNDEPSAQNHIEPDSPEGFLIGRKNVLENPDLVKPTVVMNYISEERKIPPVLMFHGTNDELVPFGQSCMLYDKLNECGKEVFFYALNGGNHGGREFWSDEILEIIHDFIRDNNSID